MSADQEGAEKFWYQIKVDTDRGEHYSKPDSVTHEDFEKLQVLMRDVVDASGREGGYINFEIEPGGGWTFIPARNINYITVLAVSDPE